MDPTNPPPLDASRLISIILYLSCISVLAQILTARCRLQVLWDIVRGRETWARICGVTVFTLSWLFAFASGVLVLGVGLPGNLEACWSLTILCIILYASTKVFIYCFLIEKVYLVWTAGSDSGRFQSTLWRICMCAIFVYIGLFVLMLTGRWARLNEAGECIVGLKLTATATTLAFDMLLTILMTFLFIYPLRRNAGMNPRLRRTATRALIAAIASLTSSSVNVVVFIATPKGEDGWICMVLCVIDVVVNSIAIYFVTYGNDSVSMNTPVTTTIAPEEQMNLSTLMIPTTGHGVLTQLSSVPDRGEAEKYLSAKAAACRIHVIQEGIKTDSWPNSDTVQEIPSPVRIILPTSPTQSTFSQTLTHEIHPAPCRPLYPASLASCQGDTVDDNNGISGNWNQASIESHRYNLPSPVAPSIDLASATGNLDSRSTSMTPSLKEGSGLRPEGDTESCGTDSGVPRHT